jgi:transporter family-2 protein
LRETLMAIAFVAGFALVPQVGFNAALRNAFGSPVAAVVVNFAVGTLGLFLFALATRVARPARGAIAGAPAWAWLGGLLGGFCVLVATIVGPRLGAAFLLVGVVLVTR